jgi:hypothetical protein
MNLIKLHNNLVRQQQHKSNYIDKDALLEQVNLLDLVEADGFVVTQRRGSEYSGCCPLHDEKNPSFSVNPDKGKFNCFLCGGGDAVDYIIKRDKVDFKTALKTLQLFVDGNYTPSPKAQKPEVAAPAIDTRHPGVIGLQIHSRNDYSERLGGYHFDPEKFEFDRVSLTAEGLNLLEQFFISLAECNQKIISKGLSTGHTLKEIKPSLKGLTPAWKENLYCYFHQYGFVCPDTDTHKIEKWSELPPEEVEKRKNNLINFYAAIPHCLAVVESPLGGVAPIFLIDTFSFPENFFYHEKRIPRPSEFMDYPQELLQQFEMDKNGGYAGDTVFQKRYFVKLLKFNHNVKPYKYSFIINLTNVSNS